MRNFVITIDGKQYQVGVEEVGATPSQVTPVVTEVKTVQAAAPAVTNGTKVNAPMPGIIKHLSKDEGATVKKGAKIYYSIIAEDAVIEEDAQVGEIPENLTDSADWRFPKSKLSIIEIIARSSQIFRS